MCSYTPLRKRVCIARGILIGLLDLPHGTRKYEETIRTFSRRLIAELDAAGLALLDETQTPPTWTEESVRHRWAQPAFGVGVVVPLSGSENCPRSWRRMHRAADFSSHLILTDGLQQLCC